jgi:ubiquinone/menaquinone biosynthesis C-methylase UbiE
MRQGTNPEVVTQVERATWDRSAETYGDTFALITGRGAPLLIEAAQVDGSCQVLEVGCGPGKVAAEFARTGATVTGVDLSARMVEIAQQRYPNIRFQEANAEQLPFDDRTFDVVVACYVVHHFARPEITFREICRVLKSGGRFAFVVPQEQASIGVFFDALGAHHTLDAVPHGPLFEVTDQRVYDSMLTAAGFTDCLLAIHEITHRWESIEPLLRGCWVFTNLGELPADLQRKIEATARKNAQAYKQAGQFVFTDSVLVGQVAKR